MKKLIAMAIPIMPGKTPQWKKFMNELKGSRFEEFAASRKKLNVRERTFLQSTPMGDFVLVTLEGDDPATAFMNFAKGNDPFTTWFVGEVKDIHGMDLTAAPKGAMPELVVDSMQSVLQS